MDDLIDKIEQIQYMRLHESDIIVLSIDQSKYTEKDLCDIYYNFNKLLTEYGLNNKIILKSKDINFDIIRKEDILNE